MCSGPQVIGRLVAPDQLPTSPFTTGPTGPIVAPPVNVTIISATVLPPGTVFSVRDRHQRLGGYQIVTVPTDFTSTYGIIYLYAEARFTGALCLPSPIFFVRVVSTVPPDSTNAAVVVAGTVTGDAFTLQLVQNPINPVVVGQTYQLLSLLPTPFVLDPATVATVTLTRKKIQAKVTSLVTSSNGTSTATGTSVASSSSVIQANTPVAVITTPPYPGMVGPYRYSLGDLLGTVTGVNGSTGISIAQGSLTLPPLVNFDQIGSGEAITWVTYDSSGGNVPVNSTEDFEVGDDVLFLSPPVSIGSISGVSTQSNGVITAPILVTNSMTAVPVTFYNSSGEVTTAVLQISTDQSTATLSNFGTAAPPQLVNGTMIWLVLLYLGYISGFEVIGSGPNYTLAMEQQFTLPGNSSLVMPTLNQGIASFSLTQVNTYDSIDVTQLPTPDTTTGPFVANSPVYYGPNVQFNGQVAGTAMAVGATLQVVPLNDLYSLPGIGDRALLFDTVANRLIPIYITNVTIGTTGYNYAYNSLTPLTQGNACTMMYADSTLLGWATTTSFGPGPQTISYDTNGGPLPASGTVTIFNQAYTIVTATTGTVSIQAVNQQSFGISSGAPITRAEDNYQGVVAVGTYQEGVTPTFTANEPLSINTGLRNNAFDITTGLFTYDGSISNLYTYISTDNGLAIFTFGYDAAPPAGAGPLWVQDQFSGVVPYAGYSTAAATATTNLVIPVNSHFINTTGPVVYQFLDSTLTPQTSLGFATGTAPNVSLTLFDVPVGVEILAYTPIYQST